MDQWLRELITTFDPDDERNDGNTIRSGDSGYLRENPILEQELARWD